MVKLCPFYVASLFWWSRQGSIWVPLNAERERVRMARWSNFQARPAIVRKRPAFGFEFGLQRGVEALYVGRDLAGHHGRVDVHFHALHQGGQAPAYFTNAGA